MYPILIHWGPLTIHTYGALLALGAALGLWLLGRLALSWGLDPERVSGLALWVLLSGLLGARAGFVLIEPQALAGQPWRFFAIWDGGLVFYGGVALALPVGVWLGRRWKLPGLKLLDCFAPALALGQVFGRLGCFSAGCCFGRPWSGPWAVVFNDPQTLAPRGIPLHPAQLYSSGALLVIFIILMLLWPRRGYPGRIFFTYGLLHGLARVIIEQFRGDWRGEPLWGSLTPTAVFALLMAAVSLVALVLLSRRNKSKEA